MARDPRRVNEPPPGAAGAPAGGDRRDRLGRGLSLTDATFLAVSSVIGSGIFLTPGRVADLLPAPELILTAWWVITFPGLAIFLSVMAFNLLGDGLQEALTPSRSR